jgi:hypothetical protein
MGSDFLPLQEHAGATVFPLLAQGTQAEQQLLIQVFVFYIQHMQSIIISCK